MCIIKLYTDLRKYLNNYRPRLQKREETERNVQRM